MDQPKATFLVFLTGKLVCSGIANEEELKITVKKFYDQLIEKSTLKNPKQQTSL
jgi:TATA-box binding protein (TBP) (component of TFIID and TFIIIB)